MYISFGLRFNKDASLDEIRKRTQKFIEDFQEWQKKDENRNHEVHLYVNQR